MCKVLQVSASGYYYWLDHPVSLRELKEHELVVQIKEVHQQSKCRYGSPRINFELGEKGIKISPSHAETPDTERYYKEEIQGAKHRLQSYVYGS